MSSASQSAATIALNKDLRSLALKHSPEGSQPVDALRRVLDAATLVHATERMRYLMVKDARMPGGFAELDHTGADGSKLKGEAAHLSRDFRVTSLSDIRLLNGHTQIEATVQIGKLELHFHFSRQPMRRGSSMPRPGWQTLTIEPPAHWIGMEDEEEGEDGEEDEEEEEKETGMGTGSKKSATKRPTTVVEYTISASNISAPAKSPSILLQVMVYGFHPSGTPSPFGVIDPAKEENEEEEGTDADGDGNAQLQQQKDVCTTEMCDYTLERAIGWCGTTLSTPEFLSFLFLFPYHEEEWDIANLALNQLLDGEEEEGDEGEEEEEEDFDFDYDSEAEERPSHPSPSPSPPVAKKTETTKKEQEQEQQAKRGLEESKSGNQGKGAKKRKT